jgi:porphobilinogen synthase
MLLQQFPTTRMRRLRQHSGIRQLVRENRLLIHDLILPLFIKSGKNLKNPIAAMPGHYQMSLDFLEEEIISIVKLGIPGVILFGIPDCKDQQGSAAWHQAGIIQQAVRIIKNIAPELLVITDVCFCEYTDHGHCGVISQKRGQWDVDNDKTLELLAKQAISHAQAGADIVAPSGMMDGMIQAIRHALDAAGHEQIPILSYAAKYASALYGPFREAAQSTPSQGNRQGYQMDPANGQEAIRETGLDLQEGADMLMIKPASAYLDVIYRVKQTYPGVPIAAYQVSGEYAMIKAAAEKGWLDEKNTALEMLIAIKRAGADFIISYFAKDLANWYGNS